MLATALFAALLAQATAHITPAAIGKIVAEAETVAPNAAAHWHRISPTPPAAAWTRIVSPALSGRTRWISMSTVRP